MKIFRIALKEYCDISGEGARRYGGRWNLPGHPALYGCNSIAAALLERLTIDSELFSSNRYLLYAVMEFECDDSLIYRPALDKLPMGWDALPVTKTSQAFGTHLIRKGIVCFEVTSVVDRTSLNLVINPQAKDFSKLSWKNYPLMLDQRIVR